MVLVIASFVRNDLLCSQGDQRGILGRKRERFVERVGVQRLAPAQNRG